MFRLHHRKELPVPILNPAPGGARYTSGKRARNFVARGYAAWEGSAIRFLPFVEVARERAQMRAPGVDADPRAWHWYVRQPQPGQIQVAQMTGRAAKPVGKPQEA